VVLGEFRPITGDLGKRGRGERETWRKRDLVKRGLWEKRDLEKKGPGEEGTWRIGELKNIDSGENTDS